MKISHIRNFSEELLETAKLVFDSSILETDLIICNELINLKEDDEDLTEQNVTISLNEKNSDDSKEIVLSNAHDTDFDHIREENFSSKNEINSDDSNDKTSLNNRIDTDFDFVNQENASSKHEKNSDDLNDKTTSNNISDIDSKKESAVSNVLNNNEDAALVYEFQDDDNPRPKKRKKRNFSTRNLYKFNCLTCEKTIQKVYGKQISICPDCGSQLYFSCKRCSKTYASFNAIYRHLKFKCYKELNKLTIGQHYEESKNSSPKQNRPKIRTKSIKKFGKKKVTNIRDLYRFYCTDCEKNVPNTDNPELICHLCNNRLQYECINCGKLYRGFIGLYSHVWTICCKKLTIQNAEKTPKEGPVLVDENKTGEETKSGNLCPKCGEMYNRGISEQCEPGKLYQCHFCSFDCCHKSNLDCHVETQHKKKINPVVYSISDIKNSTIVDDFFSRGKQKIKSLMQMYCPNCHITPENESVDLKKSSCNVCSNFLSYQCKVCNRIYSQSSAMYNHLKHDCNKQRIYKCPECHYKAKRSLHLDLHIKRIHSEKVCSGCGKRFTIGSHLKKHQLKFNCGYEPNFKCNHCDYTSNVKVGLCAHITRKHKELF